MLDWWSGTITIMKINLLVQQSSYRCRDGAMYMCLTSCFMPSSCLHTYTLFEYFLAYIFYICQVKSWLVINSYVLIARLHGNINISLRLVVASLLYILINQNLCCGRSTQELSVYLETSAYSTEIPILPKRTNQSWFSWLSFLWLTAQSSELRCRGLHYIHFCQLCKYPMTIYKKVAEHVQQ